MSILTQYGARLVASEPNKQGLCTFKLMRGTEELAHTDEPGTLEEALITSRKFLEKESNENKNNSQN
jgi:hypothetical protein